MTSVTVSGALISHVRQLYEGALEYLAAGVAVRQGINGYTDHAIPAYILAVAAVESFVNEAFLSNLAQPMYRESALWNIPSESLDRMELSMKLVLVSKLLFDKCLSRDSQPYQDMTILIKVRNGFVHYRMKGKPPKYLKALDDRRISLVASHSKTGADYAWAHKLSSSEGIRWAHNTACAVVHALTSFVPEDKSQVMATPLASNFAHIPTSYAEEFLSKKGIDPNSSCP